MQMDTLIETINLTFTSLKFYKNYVISVVKEGEVLTKQQLQELLDICGRFYQKETYVYISQRVNIYNVDPTVYMKLYNVKNLKGIAIASKHVSGLNMANFEKNFSTVPFEVFTDVKKAREWAVSLI